MNESKVFKIISEQSWYAHAYSEYLADVAQNYSNIKAIFSECLDADSEDPATIDTIISEICQRHSISPDARLILNDGTVTDVKKACQGLFITYNNIDMTMPFNSDMEQVLAGVNDVYSNTVIASKAFSSFEKYDTDISARVTSFLQDVSTAIGETTGSLRNTLDYYKELITTSLSLDDFATKFTAVSGIDDAANAGDPSAYNNCDLAMYTGVTPGVSLDFSTVNTAVNSTIKATAIAIKGVFSSIKSGVTRLFGKVKKYVIDTVIDPAVVEYVADSDAVNDGYIDGFAYYGSMNVVGKTVLSSAHFSNLFSGMYDKYSSSWIKCKTIFGEVLFRLQSDVVWDMYYKPVAIDYKFLYSNCGDICNTMPFPDANNKPTLISDFVNWLTTFYEFVKPVGKDASKTDIAIGLYLSTCLMSICMEVAVNEFASNFGYATGGFSKDVLGSIRKGEASFTINPTWWNQLNPDLVTNAIMVCVAAGDPSSSTNLENGLLCSYNPGNSLPPFRVVQYGLDSSSSIGRLITNAIICWAICRKDRVENPTNYTFIPYSNTHSSFSSASWRIKSDSDIAQTRDNFLALALTAMVVVTAVTVIGIGVAKVSRALLFKKMRYVGELDNKMWNGGRLTASEQRKYLRAKKKLNAAKLLNPNDVESTPIAANINEIITLIRGNE